MEAQIDSFVDAEGAIFIIFTSDRVGDETIEMMGLL